MPPVTANNLIVKYTVFTKASALPAVHLSSPGTQTSPALAPAGSRVWGRKGQGAGLEGQLLPLGFWLGAKAQGSVVLLTIRRTGAHAPSGWELSHQLLWTGGFRATFGPTPWEEEKNLILKTNGYNRHRSTLLPFTLLENSVSSAMGQPSHSEHSHSCGADCRHPEGPFAALASGRKRFSGQ